MENLSFVNHNWFIICVCSWRIFSTLLQLKQELRIAKNLKVWTIGPRAAIKTSYLPMTENIGEIKYSIVHPTLFNINYEKMMLRRILDKYLCVALSNITQSITAHLRGFIYANEFQSSSTATTSIFIFLKHALLPKIYVYFIKVLHRTKLYFS